MTCLFEIYGHSCPLSKGDEQAQSATEVVHMRLVRFEDINGRETFVNPDRVNHVSDYGSGTTEINFGDKQASVFVAMDISAVASTLLKAEKLR
jgi:hypothetical protein